MELSDIPRSVNRDALRRYAIGDVVVIIAFVVIGEFAHGASPLVVFESFIHTLVSFLAGWAIAAPLFGAYGDRSLDTPRGAVVTPVLAWIVADLIAQLLRATPTFMGNASFQFFLVALLLGGGLIGGWRYAAFRAWGRSSA